MKPRRGREPFYFWDVEAVEWDQPVLACIVSEDGDEHVFRGRRCLEDVDAFMRDHPGVYGAHYGGGYDVPLLLNVRGFSEIVVTGTNILSAKEGRINCRDTFPLWLSSLKAVGEAVGLEKLEVDRNAIEELDETQLAEYCLRDCHVGMRGVWATRAFMEAQGASFRWTAGSSAVSLNQALEPGAWRCLAKHRNDVDDVIAFLDDAAGRGGRNECFPRGIVRGVTSLDFKSSYPARYAALDVPIGMDRAEPSQPVGDGVWLSRWTWPHRTKIPPAVDFATQSGYGDGETWLTGDEVRAFERAGVRVERVRGWLPRDSMPIGQTFASVMFAAKEGTGPERCFSKVFLNSWHGKALEHPIKEHFTRWRPREYLEDYGIDVVGDRDARPDASWFRYHTIEVAADGKCEPYQQPIMGETILGRARAALYVEAFQAFENAGVPVLYCDTDSCHVQATAAQCASILGDAMGSTIGKLAVEVTGCVGYYLGPKAYLLVDDGGPNKKKDGAFYKTGDVVKQALKGIPLRALARGTLDADGLYREARNGEASKDLRVDLFERALYDGRAEVLKDGVSTFLRGAHGYVDAADERKKSRWGRAPQVRSVRVSGRGKSFRVVDGEPAAGWQYVSTLEQVALQTLASLAKRGITSEAWEEIPEPARGFLVKCGHVTFLESGDAYAIQISDEGRRYLAEEAAPTVFQKPGRDESPDP